MNSEAIKSAESLADFIQSNSNIFVLTGAGVSTASGLPNYRDESGNWKHQKPMEYRDFVHHQASRQRYWARSAVAWQRFVRARPNPAHHALVRLESMMKVSRLVTQNVDRLHQQAGSRGVIDLHGNLEKIVCLDCGGKASRDKFQHRLLASNPGLAQLSALPLPDGDVLLEPVEPDQINVPGCETCGGLLKPDVVFFGETVPAARVRECFDVLEASDAMLVIGSSLMVYSGLRFVRQAFQQKLPILAVNRGRTRADELFDCKIEADCASILNAALTRLSRIPKQDIPD
jgi:NAD-dependent SIR2 family protein deacetylase